LYSVIVICAYACIVGASYSDVKTKDATENEVEQTAVSSTEEKSSAGDKASRDQANVNDNEPQYMPKLDDFGQQEVAAHESKETESTHDNMDEQKLHDSGPVIPSQPKEEQQPVLDTQTENLQNLPESKTSESAGQVADREYDDSQQMTHQQADQAVGDADETPLTEKSAQQATQQRV